MATQGSQREYLSSDPQSSRIWDKPEKAQSLCLQGEAKRLSQQIYKTLGVTNVIFLN